MRKHAISLYNFEELSEEIKQKIIDKHRDINVDQNEWCDSVLEDAYIILKNLGYENTKIYFSGFGSQGDGACFIAMINIEQYLSTHKLKIKFKILLEWADRISITITHNWRYYFARSTDVNIEYYEDDKGIDSLLNELDAIIKKERETLGNEIYKNLENVYYGLISNESVAKTLRINEYEFLENGQKINLKEDAPCL